MSEPTNGPTREPGTITGLLDRNTLLRGGFIQGETGSGKTALMAEVARGVLAPGGIAPRSRARQPAPVARIHRPLLSAT